MKIKADFGTIEITKGREEIEQRILEDEFVELSIIAVVDNIWTGDDGNATEFTLNVLDIKEIL